MLSSVLVLLSSSFVAQADSYTTYDPDCAVDYALNNYNRDYGSGSSDNPWTDYSSSEGGGNCTNFASQAIIAGMICSDDADDTYDARYDFDIDYSGSSLYEWFWRSPSSSQRGPAFTGADKLYEYADYNLSSYKGLHFEYVTHDTPTSFMDYGDVEEGDIIFADWTGDGTIDHTMIVTDIQGWRSGYNEIRLTYQGDWDSIVGKTNIGLGDINISYDYEALFYVYRPVDYSPTGL